MNKKLILLCVIVLIIILLGCMFITNEGFQTQDMNNAIDQLMDRFNKLPNRDAIWTEFETHNDFESVAVIKQIDDTDERRTAWWEHIELFKTIIEEKEKEKEKKESLEKWCNDLSEKEPSCKQSTSCLGLIYSECGGDTNTDCEWKNNQCNLKCERITDEVKCNNNSSICTWSSQKCLPTENDVDCNKITITNDGNKIELPINKVCPTDPNCVQVCINDHTWINKDGLNNNTKGFGEQVSGSLKNANDTHLLTSSGCMQCIKNFYPIVNLIDKHECTF